MTRRTWGVAAGVAALLAVASMAPATAVQTVDGGILSLANPHITWGGASDGLSPTGLCENLGGESCYQFDLELAEDLSTQEIHISVFPTLVGPGVEADFSLNNSENPEDWTVQAGVNPETTNANPAADYDIYLFNDGTQDLASADDPANNKYGSYSDNIGPVFDEIVLFAGDVAAGHYDLVVVAKVAAPGTTFQSDIRATDPSCTITDENPCDGAH